MVYKVYRLNFMNYKIPHLSENKSLEITQQHFSFFLPSILLPSTKVDFNLKPGGFGA